MAGERIVELIRSATELNLRYSATTLKLAKEYIKELDGVVRNGIAAAANGHDAVDRTTEAADRRPPILLVGQAGSQASGAFVLNNTAPTELAVALAVQGEPGAAEAELEPASMVIPPGGSAVVQLRVQITEAMDTGRDYSGAVIAPGLAAEAVGFVVRRLPGETPAGQPSRASAKRQRSGE